MGHRLRLKDEFYHAASCLSPQKKKGRSEERPNFDPPREERDDQDLVNTWPPPGRPS
jgi:hypothetical protein